MPEHSNLLANRRFDCLLKKKVFVVRNCESQIGHYDFFDGATAFKVAGSLVGDESDAVIAIGQSSEQRRQRVFVTLRSEGHNCQNSVSFRERCEKQRQSIDEQHVDSIASFQLISPALILFDNTIVH